MRVIYILAAMIVLGYGCSGSIANTKRVNTEASLPVSFRFDEMGLTKVINSSINRKKGSMSTLYGNDVAFGHSSTAADSSYPAGSVLALVTWKQQEDENWFGANIPGALIGIELVKVTPQTVSYRLYKGDSLAPADTDTLQMNARIKYILAEKPSIIP